jgi:glucose-1-phosphate thymidylyltransferase
MHAIIPAAGFGTRLRPHTFTTPKALLPVAGRPILGHIIDLLIPAGVTRITLVVGHLGDELVAWVKSNYGIEVSHTRQEILDGLASAVALAAPWADPGPTLVVLGDTLFTADLIGLRGCGRNMLAVSEVDDPSRFGIVVESGGRILRLVEKPSEYISNLAIVGVYYFESGTGLISACTDLIASGRRTRGEFQLTDAMQMMLEGGSEFGLFRVSDWFDCGKPETLLETNRVLLSRSGGNTTSLRGALLVPPVHIGRGVVSENCVLGPHASIGDGATMRNCVVRNSVISESCRIEDCVLDGCILGREAGVRGRAASLSIGDCSTLSL